MWCFIFYCVLLMCRSGTAYPVRILVFVQTALPLVFTYSLFPRLTPAGILVFVQTALPLVFTYSDSSRGSIATVAIQWMRYVRAYARGINYWIATPSAMARNDKDDKIHITWILGSKYTPQKHSFLWGPRVPG